MIHPFLETGKIVGTHGIAGMVRIHVWSDTPSSLCALQRVYTDNSGKNYLEIQKAAPHGNVVIAKLSGIDSIEQAEKLRNTVLYVKRDDIDLPPGKYFIADLIGCEAYDNTSGELLGVLCDVSQTGANDVWHIGRNGREYLIPVIDEVVNRVDVENSKVMITPLKGIFDDEN